MTDYTPMSSASDRYAAARKALNEYDGAIDSMADATDMDEYEWAKSRADKAMQAGMVALRALIATERNHDSAATIAGKVLDDYFTLTYEEMVTDPSGETVYAALMAAARAGEQSALETWEPEVALRPTQEQMLRWLGIDCEEHRESLLFIPEQSIEKEED